MQNPSFLVQSSLAVCFLVVLGWLIASAKHIQTARQLQPNQLAVRLQKYSRTIVYMLAIGWSLVLFAFAAYRFPDTDSALRFLTRAYGLTAIFCFPIVLTPGLLRVYFPYSRWKTFWLHTRRSFGLSTFYFVCLHILIGFYSNLSGSFHALSYLGGRYQIAIALAIVSTLILLAMAMTSTDTAFEKLGRYWKRLHRFVYLAIVAAIIHVLLIGSSYLSFQGRIAVFTLALYLCIIWLEAIATLIEQRRHRELSSWAGRSLAAIMVIVLLASPLGYASLLYVPPYNPHAGHTSAYDNRYSMVITSPPPIAGTPQQIQFHIRNNLNDRTQTNFLEHYTKIMHLVVVNSQLTYYQHVHPTLAADGTFTQELTFPRDDVYYFYADYVTDNQEVISPASIAIDNVAAQPASLTPTATTQVVADNQVSMHVAGSLKAGHSVELVFSVTGRATNSPVSLQPYLGAYGHLVGLSSDLKTYVHIHPNTADDNGNPTKPTSPLIFYTSFSRPGLYKLYLDYQINGTVQSAQYVIEVAK